ncbi:3-deoxy-D-manno-octulosonic acid kinase [Vreelandella venusta]|uniref:3-deoxy-D-manno-octulosonic acid kinase n=1 Tax=Vreelandella venusta TaxID=44935 RepID=UPI00384E84BD
MRLAALQQKNGLILHDVDSLSDVSTSHQLNPTLFEEKYWRRQGLIVGEAPGRGSSLFLQASDHEQWVLRPYRRGGLVAKLSHKRYLWLGRERTRAFRELRLTAMLYEQGLPVPRPVACCVTRFGLTYEAALITVRIPGAQALASLLSDNAADEALLRRVGVMIKRFHQAGLDHVDLNARNILIDLNGEPWLIDLDRCRLRTAGTWQKRNLKRLARSLEKLQAGSTIHVIKTGYNQKT